MDKIKIGIPKALTYYYYKNLWINFFDKLGCEVVISCNTNKEMFDQGLKYSNDEMCLSLKVYLTHINYLKDKCDYILIPRIDNYGVNNQTCTNFLSLYDLVNNIFNVKILNYNISSSILDNQILGFLKMGKKLGFSFKEIMNAYTYAVNKDKKINKKNYMINYNKLSSDKMKLLVVGHPYNLYDSYFGTPIIEYLKKLNIEVIMSDQFDPIITNKLSTELSKSLYWKYSKEAIGSIKLVEDKVDGIIFISSFPCGPDSLVNELVIRKINQPYLNLIIDDMDSLTGIYTRIESFIDIIESRKSKVN